MSVVYCQHKQDARFCHICNAKPIDTTKIINIANHNIKKAHDAVSERLLKAKEGEKSSVWIDDVDDIVYLSHQNTIISFTPEQAVSISEGLMTLGWQLKEEAKENENVEETSKEPGEPVKND